MNEGADFIGGEAQPRRRRPVTVTIDDNDHNSRVISELLRVILSSLWPLIVM
jgi:hypothetical protein